MNDYEGPALSRAEISNLESALLEYKQAMLDQDIHPDNFRVVITSDLRAAVGEQEWPLFLRRMEEKLGKIIDVLDPLEEAAYLYASTLRTAPGVTLRRSSLVVEVSEDTIRLVFGKGPRKIEETLTTKGLLPFGTQALSLEDAFGPIDVALARETARAALRDGLSQELTDAAKGRNVYLAGDSVLDLLFALESERPVSEANPILNGLDATIMDWYLSPEGLEHLQRVEQEGRYTESLGPNAIVLLIERLVFLRELPAALGFERYRFGSGGGEQAGLLDEMVRTEVSRRMERYGRALHKRYRREYPEAQRILDEIFPDVRVRGRAKDATSIADKLNRKAMRTGPQKQVIQDADDASRLIGDGHGLRLVLETTRRDRIETIREQLINAIRNGVVQILEINNCHAGGPDALPYFSEEDIIRIRMAAETTRRALPTEERPPVVKVLDGPGAIKPSGYTTTQLNIRLRNPETGHFDLICELQIRGIEVERFSAAEHLIHDFRRGKDPYKKNPRIREHFEPEVAPLLKAIQEMREAEFRKFTDYLSRFYLHCRRLESGYTVPEPELPVDLPAVCHVNNIKRLSRLQRELIARFKRPARKPPTAANPAPVKPEVAR